MTTETTNGQLTGHWETFRDRANRLRTVSSLDRLLRQVIATVPKDATKVREKIQRKFADRKAIIEKQEKSQANRVIHNDEGISRKSFIGKLVCATLSAYLNAQASVLGFKAYCRDNPEHYEMLQGTMFPGTSVNFATVTEVMAFVYGIAIPVLVLILWAVAGGLLKRAGKITRPAMGCFIGGTFLLLLSMYHCTESLMLFGLPWYMAFAYAFGIDWGLVSLEIGQLFSSDVEI